MELHRRPEPGSPITPIEPSAAIDARGIEGDGRHAVHATAFGRFDVAVATSRGAHRLENEDAHSELGGRGSLFVVADGVGGGAMARFASQMLVRELHAALEGRRLDPGRLRAAMLHADRAIARSIADRTDLPGAATVVLAGPVDAFGARWMIGWVGDCRAYRVAADGEPEPLTRDDTFRALGEAPPANGSPDDPARMVGNGATAGANAAYLELDADDLLVLCTDGVHKHLEPHAWRRALQQAGSLAGRCTALIAAARRAGSADDATVLALQRSTWFSMRRPRALLPGRRGNPEEGPRR
jgi:protein phosphatase